MRALGMSPAQIAKFLKVVAEIEADLAPVDKVLH